MPPKYSCRFDEFDPKWDYSGPMEDITAPYVFGEKLADSEAWPNWYESNEFRSIRDASLAGK